MCALPRAHVCIRQLPLLCTVVVPFLDWTGSGTVPQQPMSRPQSTEKLTSGRMLGGMESGSQRQNTILRAGLLRNNHVLCFAAASLSVCRSSQRWLRWRSGGARGNNANCSRGIWRSSNGSI